MSLNETLHVNWKLILGGHCCYASLLMFGVFSFNIWIFYTWVIHPYTCQFQIIVNITVACICICRLDHCQFQVQVIIRSCRTQTSASILILCLYLLAKQLSPITIELEILQVSTRTVHLPPMISFRCSPVQWVQLQ